MSGQKKSWELLIPPDVFVSLKLLHSVWRSQVTNGMWSSGVRFIDRTSKDFHDVMTHTIVTVLGVTDKHYLEEIRPLATKTVLERLRKRLENIVSRYRGILKTKLGKLIS